MRRDKVIRIGAIVIVLALLLSLLAGAFSITPSQAAEPAKSVQITQADDSPLGDSVDTDGDGIVNNLDPDVDGDGLVNGKDSDIDGDGNEEQRPGKRNKWLYRIGGVAVMFFTLKLAGVI